MSEMAAAGVNMLCYLQMFTKTFSLVSIVRVLMTKPGSGMISRPRFSLFPNEPRFL